MKARSIVSRALFGLLFLVPSSGATFAADSGPGTAQHVPANGILEAPKPEYPDAAKQRNEHGAGVYLLRTKIATGVVTEIIIGQSTGSVLLDDAAVKALRRWRFKPGVLVHRDIHKPHLKRPIAKDECLVLVSITF
jgi:TonB family protein